MTGLLLVFLALMWIGATAWVSNAVARRFARATWRVPLEVLLVVTLLPLPLIDEIVGGWQFKRLCKSNSQIQVDHANAAGKTVYFSPQPNVEIPGTWVHVVLRPQRFIDSTTHETVVSYNELIASGGWLIRALGISEGGVPLTFKGTCVPPDRPATVQSFKRFGINYVEPPQGK